MNRPGTNGTMRAVLVGALAGLVALAAPGPAGSHPLPLDSSGCHWAGTPPRYHCHPDPGSPRTRREPRPRPPGPLDRSENTGTGHLVQVIRVPDGDTIHVKIDGRTEKVRYIGVSAPEEGHLLWPDADMTHAARMVNARLVLGKRVVLEYDEERRDGLGRLLAYVWVDDVMVNAEMVRLGYAQAIDTPNLRHQALLQRLEREAKDNRRGLWGRVDADGAVVKRPAPPVDAPAGPPRDRGKPAVPSGD